MTPPGGTTTGAVLERMISDALTHGGYAWERPRKAIGLRPGGGRHFVDLIVHPSDSAPILVSLKWQQSSGTAEQKIPFEVISLAEALRTMPEKPSRAYLVLGGKGWTLREFYTAGGLNRHLRDCDLVRILDMEDFIARANRGRL